MPSLKKLTRDFYTRSNTLLVARELLGKLLVVPTPDGERVSGIIVETEAYHGPLDKASHAYAHRRTPRTESMFGMGGTVYVYFIYGMYHQFNVVTHIEGEPSAVLIRALEPQEGLDVMRLRRPVKPETNLTNGPGKLCKALGIDRRLDRASLLGDEVWIEEFRSIKPRQIATGPRIGLGQAEEYLSKPWRFWVKDNPFVSRQ